MSLRITIIGAGGVGGYFGARLAQGGGDVGFVARASEDPAALGPADEVLLCVKLWDTEAAARAAQPIVRPETAVISLQNGARKEEMLRQVFGEWPSWAESVMSLRKSFAPVSFARPGRCSGWSSVNATAPFHGEPRVFSRPASAAESRPKSAPISSARSGKSLSS